jgi:WD40 repeat protein/serine/threonine protein kinase
MAVPLNCPAPECWQALLDDTFPADRRADYERHLEACPACQERLDRSGECDDTLRALVRRGGRVADAPADPTLVLFLERLYEGKGLDRPTGGDAADLSFLRPGERPGILGRLGAYEVRELIGRGGMGVVLKAFDPALHRLVAIKVLAPALAGSATARQRFIREAQAAAAISHDHVVAVHRVAEEDGLPYLVMPYVAGESLQSRLDRTGPLDVTEVARIGYEAASGLAAAHARGVIHRDIKPGNLLLEGEEAHVKITDFGLARAVNDVGLTQQGVVAGTPEYMAPEQARGEKVDHRADLFSLGSVLYACCTGGPPFRGETPLAVLRRVTDEAPPPIRNLEPRVPAWLDIVVARLLAKDPAQRFQTAAEVATLLGGYLDHLRQPARVPAPDLPPSPLPVRAGGPENQEKGTERPFRPPGFRSAPLLVLVVLAALGLGSSLLLLAVPAGDEAAPGDPPDAIAALEKLGAKVIRDESLPGKPVVEADLKDTKVTDAELKALASLTRLRSLDLRRTAVTDNGLKELAPLRELRALELGETRVAGPGLRDLAPLARLETLRLERTPVTDAGLAALTALPQIRSLSLEGAEVTDQGLKAVGTLKHLVALNLGQTKVTDAGLKELTGLTELGWLGLYFTAVTDAGMKDIAQLKQLQDLRVNGTAVTDQGLKELAALKNLHKVDLRDTGVSDAGVKDLGAAIPPVTVDAPLPEEPGHAGSKGWLTVGLIVGLMVAVILAVYVWLYRRYNPARAGGSRASSVPGLKTGTVSRPLNGLWVAPLGILAALGLGALLLGRGGAGEGAGTNRPVVGQSVRRLQGHTGSVHDLRFTPDGRLVSGSGWKEGDHSVRVWDPATGQELRRIPTPSGVRSLALSADGRFALAGLSRGPVLYLDLDTGQVVNRFLGHGLWVVSWVAFAPDGRHAFSGSEDGTVRQWNLEDGKEVSRVHVEGKWVNGGAVLPDGRRLLTADDGGRLQLWDLAAGQEIKRIDLGHVWVCCLGLTPDGRQALVGTMNGNVWDLDTGERVRVFEGHDGEVRQMALSPDGRQLLTASWDGKVRLWDFPTGELRRVLGSHDELVFAAAFSPDGRLAASGGGGRREGKEFLPGSDFDIRLWDLGGGTATAAVPRSRARGWLTAAGLLGLGLALGLAGWLFVRQRLHAGRTGAPVAGGAGPAKPDPAAAPVSFACPGCGKVLKARGELAGKRAKCPHCGQMVRVARAGTDVSSPATDAAPRTFPRPKVWWGIGLASLILAAGLLGWLLLPRRPGQRLSFVNVTVGSEAFPEIDETGFHCQECYRGQPFRWTTGDARLVIPIDPTKPPDALLVQLAAYRESAVAKPRLEIVVNDRSRFKGEIPLGRPWDRVIDLRDITLGDRVVLELLSDTFSPLGQKRGDGKGTSGDPRTLGVQVLGTKLLRDADRPPADPVRAIPPRFQVEQAHPEGIGFAAVSADGKTRLSGSWDGTVQACEVIARGGARPRPLVVVPDLRALAVSPDGRTFATAGRDRVVRVWDTGSAEPRAAFSGHTGQVLGLAFSPDGQTLASAGDDNLNGGELKLWDLAGRRERVAVEPFPFRLWGLAYAPDGKSVAVLGAARSAQTVDTTTGQLRTTFDLPFYGRHVAYSPDGRLLGVVSGQDGWVRLYELEGGRPRPDFQVPGGQRLFGLHFAADGKRLLTPAADGTTILWDVSAREARPAARLERHDGPVRFALFLPDGQTAVTGGEDRTLRLWDLGNPE